MLFYTPTLTNVATTQPPALFCVAGSECRPVCLTTSTTQRRGNQSVRYPRVRACCPTTRVCSLGPALLPMTCCPYPCARRSVQAPPIRVCTHACFTITSTTHYMRNRRSRRSCYMFDLCAATPSENKTEKSKSLSRIIRAETRWHARQAPGTAPTYTQVPVPRHLPALAHHHLISSDPPESEQACPPDLKCRVFIGGEMKQ